MATIVERTLHEEGLDLTTVDFCTRGLLVLLRSVFKFPPNSDEPSENPGWLLGCLWIQGTLDATGTTSKQQHNLCCPGLICTKIAQIDKIALSSPILKKIQGCFLSLQSPSWAHCTACCKSPKYHFAKSGMTPLPASPYPVSPWAVLTFPWAGAWSAAPQGFHVADIP